MKKVIFNVLLSLVMVVISILFIKLAIVTNELGLVFVAGFCVGLIGLYPLRFTTIAAIYSYKSYRKNRPIRILNRVNKPLSKTEFNVPISTTISAMAVGTILWVIIVAGIIIFYN